MFSKRLVKIWNVKYLYFAGVAHERRPKSRISIKLIKFSFYMWCLPV